MNYSICKIRIHQYGLKENLFSTGLFLSLFSRSFAIGEINIYCAAFLCKEHIRSHNKESSFKYMNALRCSTPPILLLKLCRHSLDPKSGLEKYDFSDQDVYIPPIL